MCMTFSHILCICTLQYDRIFQTQKELTENIQKFFFMIQ